MIFLIHHWGLQDIVRNSPLGNVLSPEDGGEKNIQETPK